MAVSAHLPPCTSRLWCLQNVCLPGDVSMAFPVVSHRDDTSMTFPCNIVILYSGGKATYIWSPSPHLGRNLLRGTRVVIMIREASFVVFVISYLCKCLTYLMNQHQDFQNFIYQFSPIMFVIGNIGKSVVSCARVSYISCDISIKLCAYLSMRWINLIHDCTCYPFFLPLLDTWMLVNCHDGCRS